MPLSDTKIRNAKPREKGYTLADGAGLVLYVNPNGTKVWRYRFRWHGKQQLYTIGAYPLIGLADARKARETVRALVAKGVHPTRHKKAERARRAVEAANTFETVAREWIDKKKPGWSPSYLQQVERFLEVDVFPAIGALPIGEVTAAQLLAVLQTVEKRGAETVALLVRQWCSAIFRYAVATLRAEYDPAAALKGALHRPKVRPRAALSKAGIGAFLQKLEAYGGQVTTCIALRLLLFTFVRPSELRLAKWSEFDLQAADWRIPAERMKMGEAHLVPLSSQAVELLRELRALTGHQEWLFPNVRRPRHCMSATSFNRALERMGFGGKFSAHGFRATASTLLNEMGYNADWIERQLAHAPRNKVRASYNQAQYVPERRQMMREWSDMVEALGKPTANVIPLRASA